MTHLRKMMLEELQRRNYSKHTAEAYIRALRDFAAYYNLPPDRLPPEQIRSYQLHMMREKRLADNPASQSAFCRRALPDGSAWRTPGPLYSMRSCRSHLLQQLPQPALPEVSEPCPKKVVVRPSARTPGCSLHASAFYDSAHTFFVGASE
jgi:hypothetical protein